MSDIFVGVIAAIVGFISGLLAPWIKWQIERRKEKLLYHRELIKSWRSAISSQEYDVGDGRSTFLSSSEYSSLRIHLCVELLKKVEAKWTIYGKGARGGFYRNEVLLDEVARLEKKWGLV